MISAQVLVLAYALDLLVGDPRWLPHPVRFIGSAISALERLFRRFVFSPAGERAAGIALVLAIVLPVYFLTDGLVQLLAIVSARFSPIAGTAVLVVLAATTIATRGLLQSAGLVIASIREGNRESARQHVSMIVGRDTRELSEKGVLRATIETLAENLSDGVVAPLLYMALGGLPLAMAYKAVNTLDSMVGYKNERYRSFGWASARLDDAANYIPARLSGLIIVASVFLFTLVRNTGSAITAARRAFFMMVRDGRKHPSPNSGMPEAAMAGALDVRLGGPSQYGGVVCDKPFIGDGDDRDYLAASHTAMRLVMISSVAAAGIAAGVAALRGIL